MLRFKVQAEPPGIVIHNDLQRLIRSEMLEQARQDRVTILRIDVRNVDHMFISAWFGHGVSLDGSFDAGGGCSAFHSISIRNASICRISRSARSGSSSLSRVAWK